ncbi:MAG: precorrin-6y C5,15-methyltransferase (decarboxylating) subunit CbiE [Angelakisella sp.]
MKITIVGMGMGSSDTLTLGGLHALEQAQLVIGAGRLLGSIPAGCSAKKQEAIMPEVIAHLVEENQCLQNICVIMSGDSGFYSGAKKLLPLLSAYDVTVLPGIATVQYMAARLGRSWQGVHLVSAHGQECNIVGNILMADETFFLTGGTITPKTIIEQLHTAEIPGITIHVGENLSYPNEQMTSGTPQELVNMSFAPLSAVWVHREPLPKVHGYVTGGIPDELFIRGAVPMTKQEVRAIALAKLGISESDVLYDIGAGTGSVSVEMAHASPMAQVFAVEVKEEACELVRQNRARFGAYNITLVQGSAPEAMELLPKPNAAFIGGSKGNIHAILRMLKQRNPDVRVVVTAIALETLSEASAALKELGFQNISVTQIAVSRTNAVGGYHMLTAQNPVFILSAGGEH